MEANARPERYVDLWVAGDPEIIKRLHTLGFSACAVVGGLEGLKELRTKGSETGMRIVGKIVHEARSRSDVLNRIRERPRNALVSIAPMTREALMVAVRDERVDTVIVHGDIAEIDRHVIQVLQNPLELTLQTMLKSLKDMKAMRKIAGICRTSIVKELPLIISSGAQNATGLRKPRQLAYLASALAGVKAPHLEAVSEMPYTILVRRGLIDG
jgi:RNase P/RNase MRP subunit p30